MCIAQDAEISLPLYHDMPHQDILDEAAFSIVVMVRAYPDDEY
jgi:hypothetical protein